MALPPLYHWYVGELPPLTGAAVKVTFCPEHIEVPEPDVILTAGVTAPEILIVIALEVALLVVTHCELETILQVITSALARVVDE